ncbi:hypothetical protein H5410_002815 [Solanum commersonii]|uniref:Uncharacterized protein n=1 Tax=Solanum commersonii TaxID=4109 RepID=A0A9J6B3E1_SOLCO|nr:hypothetical protein H5410_002815 [Solanum commersonii]
MHSVIRPLVCFIAFQLFPSAFLRSELLGNIVLLRGIHTGTLGEVKASRRLGEPIRGSSGLLFFVFSAVFDTQDSIMNVHNKAQITPARISFTLKDSRCDTPLSKILKLTILASNASSSSKKEIKFPHTKNESIFTHNILII